MNIQKGNKRRRNGNVDENDDNDYNPSEPENKQRDDEYYKQIIEERDVTIISLRDEIARLKSKIYDLMEDKKHSEKSSSMYNVKKNCQRCGESNDITNSFCTTCYTDFLTYPFH
jgi:hypothetical protein